MKLSLALALCLFTVGAFAHEMHLFVQESATGLRGLVSYGENDPVEGATVRLSTSDDQEIGVAVTGADGRYEFPDLAAGLYRVTAGTADGHQVEVAHSVRELAVPRGGSTTDPASLEEAVRKGIAPLEERIDRLEQRTGLRDIIGGIGYVVGVVGLLTLLRRRRES